jgi:predicted lipoprotein with Yx(FWY)xxD motif
LPAINYQVDSLTIDQWMERSEMTRRGGTMTGVTRTPAEEAARPARTGWRTGLRIVGPGLLVASGAIHLDLYLTGYRTIPTIGWLFLLQVIAAFALGLAAAGLRTWLAAAAAAGFCLATLGGYILSLWIGLFGFKEVRTTAGIVAGVIEIAAFAALAALALAGAPWSGRTRAPAALAKTGGMVTAGLAVVALALLGVSVGTAGSHGQVAARGALKTTIIHGTTVLTNAKGDTLYWFAPDTPSASKCYGTCAAYWPPVPGPATAGPGVTGRLGTITRTGGSSQVTYDGHPLYTYIGDTAPGQANGNNIDLNGGLWHEVVVSG